MVFYSRIEFETFISTASSIFDDSFCYQATFLYIFQHYVDKFIVYETRLDLILPGTMVLPSLSNLQDGNPVYSADKFARLVRSACLKAKSSSLLNGMQPSENFWTFPVFTSPGRPSANHFQQLNCTQLDESAWFTEDQIIAGELSVEDASDPPKVEAQNEGLNVKQQNTKDEVDRKPCSSRNAVKVQDIKDASNSKTTTAKAEETNRKKVLDKAEESKRRKELAKAEETKKLKELAKAEETKRQKEITKTEETPGYKKLKIRTDLTDSNSTVVKESNITYVPHQDKSASVKHINENILKETVTLFEKRTEICQNKTALSQSSAGTMTLVDPSLPPIKQEPADADNDVIVDLVKYERPGADLMLPGPSSSSSSTSGDKQEKNKNMRQESSSSSVRQPGMVQNVTSSSITQVQRPEVSPIKKIDVQLKEADAEIARYSQMLLEMKRKKLDKLKRKFEQQQIEDQDSMEPETLAGSSSASPAKMPKL